MGAFSNMDSLGRKILGFILLSTGVIGLFFISYNMIRDFPIWFFGHEVTAVVEETILELDEENAAGEMSFKYYVRYQFTTLDGDTVTGMSKLGIQEWSSLSEGNEISVVYSPIDSTNNRMDDSQYMPMMLCAYFPFMILIWFVLAKGWKMLSAEFKKPESHPWTPKD